MLLREYEELAMRTASTVPQDKMVVVAALGLAGEAGEFADHVKKHVAQGHALDRQKLINEAGDVLWYLALAARALSEPLEDIARENVDKLRARYPNGFAVEASVSRTE